MPSFVKCYLNKTDMQVVLSQVNMMTTIFFSRNLDKYTYVINLNIKIILCC